MHYGNFSEDDEGWLWQMYGISKLDFAVATYQNSELFIISWDCLKAFGCVAWSKIAILKSKIKLLISILV